VGAIEAVLSCHQRNLRATETVPDYSDMSWYATGLLYNILTSARLRHVDINDSSDCDGEVLILPMGKCNAKPGRNPGAMGVSNTKTTATRQR
jgi:hypothetical protein